MLKNNTCKFNKFFITAFVLCLFALFSAVCLLGTGQNVMADVVSVKPNNTYIANDYIFEDEQELDLVTNKSSFIFEAGDTDASSMSYYCLRDDYVIYTQNQTANGLCWAFASSMALGTTFMLETGEFYDFSEAWVGLATSEQSASYVYGDGGNALMFNASTTTHGLVLESDMTYDVSHIISEENASAYYDYYSQFANKTLLDNINAISYNSSKREDIKNHIYNNGGLSIGMYWNTGHGRSGVMRSTSGEYSYKFPSGRTSTTGGHAITVIGWDDTVTETVNGVPYKGAWICLNSWGEDVNGDDDGILYVFYNDGDIYGTLYGYEYEADQTDSIYFNNNIKDGTGYTTYSTGLKGKYYSGYTASSNATKQQNIFFSNNVDITYEYDISASTNINSISIIYGSEDVTVDFDIELDETNKEYTIKASNLRYGPYKILVEYSNGSLTEEYTNILYVNGDAVLEYMVLSYSSSASGISNNGYYLIYNTYNYAGINLTIATTKHSGTFYVYGGRATYGNFSSPTSLVFEYTIGTDLPTGTTATTVVESLTGVSGMTLPVTMNVTYIADASTHKQVNMFYGLNGGVNPADNLSREVFSTTDGMQLSEPSRKGYNFEGWYYDSAFTTPVESNLFKYENVVAFGSKDSCYSADYYQSYCNNTLSAFVYAKWSLKEPTGATLTSDRQTYTIGQNYVVSVGSITHDLGKLMQVVSVDWFLNGSKISTTAKELEQTASTYGRYVYTARLTLKYREHTVYADTSELEIVVLDAVSSVNYANGTFSWSAVGNATGFVLKLYKEQGEDLKPLLVKTENQTETTYSLFNNVSSEGDYYLSVSAIIEYSGTNYESVEANSATVTVYEVSFVSYNKTINSLYVDGTTAVNVSTPEIRAGYTFIKWCIDEEKQTAFSNGQTISESICLYALWEMDDINIEANVANVNREYSGEASEIAISASHASGLNGFVYEWQYKQSASDEYEIIAENTTNSVSVLNVADSGYYLCNITLTDADGFSVSNSSNAIMVTISKQTTSINTDMVVKEYEYNGNVQKVNKGAKLLDSYGQEVKGVEFVYMLIGDGNEELGDSFVNVPTGGLYKLRVSTQGNENYSGAMIATYINVEKATSQIVISKAWQTFRYCGKPIMPEYTLLSAPEQTVDEATLPINKGEYDVTLVAQETRNYKSIDATVHITIAPANIKIKANDVTSVLFFGMQELSYSIEGEIYEGDELNLQLHADVDTGRIGTYQISVTSDNDNYIIALEYGKYTVTGISYYIAGGILLLVAYFVIKMLAKRRYQYDFETNGGGIVSPIDTKNRKELEVDVPEREGYTFAGWYTDLELSKPFNNKFVKSKGKTLYAKWQKNEVQTPELSDETKTAQQIVDEIDQLINPHSKTNVEQKAVEQPAIEEPKEPTEQEKLQDLIKSVNESNGGKNVSNAEMEDFIKKILDANNQG